MNRIADAEQLKRIFVRLAHEIVERNENAEEIVVLGIRRRGALVAERIANNLESILGKRPPCSSLDVTKFRDDIPEELKAKAGETSVNFSVKEKHVILCDDVLFTGRTVRAAITAILTEIGRPKTIQLLVVADRGHRELPIRADFIGKNIPTSLKEKVAVRFLETDGDEGVFILKEGDLSPC